jgi:hypothetical protein
MKKFILIFVIIFIIFSLNINASSDNNSSPNDNISIPNLFYSGSVISSSQINRNFEYLLQLIKFNIILLTLDNVTIGYARESLYNTGSETTYEVL